MGKATPETPNAQAVALLYKSASVLIQWSSKPSKANVCLLITYGVLQCQPEATPTNAIRPNYPNPIPTVANPPIATVPTGGGPIVVLPLGDSITYDMGSSDGNLYRKELDSLSRDDYNTAFIGTMRTGNMLDNANEGHVGATIAQISGFAEMPLRQTPHVSRLPFELNLAF